MSAQHNKRCTSSKQVKFTEHSDNTDDYTDTTCSHRADTVHSYISK